MKGEQRQCLYCGATFVKRSYYAKFCSRTCGNANRTDHSPETAMARFWAKVDKSPGFGPNGDCWRWTGRVEGHGYGEMKIAGRYKKHTELHYSVLRTLIIRYSPVTSATTPSA